MLFSVVISFIQIFDSCRKERILKSVCPTSDHPESLVWWQHFKNIMHAVGRVAEYFERFHCYSFFVIHHKWNVMNLCTSWLGSVAGNRCSIRVLGRKSGKVAYNNLLRKVIGHKFLFVSYLYIILDIKVIFP